MSRETMCKIMTTKEIRKRKDYLSMNTKFYESHPNLYKEIDDVRKQFNVTNLDKVIINFYKHNPNLKDNTVLRNMNYLSNILKTYGCSDKEISAFLSYHSYLSVSTASNTVTRLAIFDEVIDPETDKPL